MSDEGEKTCPLCAEEMDPTDQQLKPCKCGYEICVWCWHHIMDMAEKDAVEGRCPACRTPYNKEKIVGTMPNCEKIVAEMNMEKKLKSQKTKCKTSDSRKQLNNMRVIQRNLVYIVGLPLNLADEELLQSKEYFGKYGRVLKVSISRTAAGAIQQFANSTCSVYITYTQEEEAVCCIQSVHGFLLDGRPLRACFGTTKYCHAWLRNVPCTNPDCLYLHEIGSQEDSFTKDEVISAYTRSRVQQITGATNCVQRRSGTLLPPPADDYCHNGSAALAGKPISKSLNISATSARVSPPNSSSGRSAALPAGALWGTRPSNSQPPSASLPCSNGSLRAKPDKCSDAVKFSTAVGKSSFLNADPGKQLICGEESSNNQDKSKIKISLPANQYAGADQAYVTETLGTHVLPSCSSVNSQFHGHPASKEKDGHSIKPSNPTSSFDHSMKSNRPGSQKDSDDTAKIDTQILCPDMSSLSIDRLQKSRQSFTDQSREPLSSQIESKVAVYSDESHITSDTSDSRLDLQTSFIQDVTCGNGDNSLSAYDQRPREPESSTDRSHNPNSSESFHSSTQCLLLSDNVGSIKSDMQIVGKFDSILPSSGIQGISDGYRDDIATCKTALESTDRSCFSLSNVDQRKEMKSFEGGLTGASRNIIEDMEESSIISNILSLDFDPWSEPLTSPQNLVKLLGDTDKKPPLSSFKLHSSNQSRFSFAREEEPISQTIDLEPSLCYIEQGFNNCPSHNFSTSRGFQPDNLASRRGFSLVNKDSNSFSNSYLSLSNHKSSVSRSEMSAPPGFSATSRAPPPIFMSHNRMENNFDSLPGNYSLQTPMLRNQYQAPPTGNMVCNEDDIEFIDPAILAVHKGNVPSGSNASGLNVTSGFPLQLSTSENEGRLHFLMQRSLSPLKNQRFPDTGDSFSAFGDAYRIPSGILEQTLSSNLSAFSSVSVPESRSSVMSNGNWDIWNRINGQNDLGVSELLQTERLGLNKLYTGYEDSKFGMTNSGNLYRTYGF
ncbi:uncharacterized protein LOC116004519 isoform X2 [Ipomoea triloba]|uniref:uncharacterized protein LOC116004519 isoform X2 n=1 Tax=Ipomoea triloba TaxID=35885 RepID=UPI00125CF40A|nr:uncharacterized protein LOC116004519 isoform X2 [Ipomoea triloba]